MSRYGRKGGDAVRAGEAIDHSRDARSLASIASSRTRLIDVLSAEVTTRDDVGRIPRLGHPGV